MASSAGDSAAYSLEKIVAKATKKKPARFGRVGFTVEYTPADDTVTVGIVGNQTFPNGGLLTVSDAVASAHGAAITGNDVFAIGEGGRTIRPE
jgi:hypothetical protein